MGKGRVAKIAFRTAGVAVGSLALLGGVGWLGLQVNPAPFPPHPERTRGLGTADLPHDLPEPTRRHFRATLGKGGPRIGTAVVWGRGRFNRNGLLWFPRRFKYHNIAAREFRRDRELTWFGVPVFRSYDAYLGERGP